MHLIPPPIWRYTNIVLHNIERKTKALILEGWLSWKTQMVNKWNDKMIRDQIFLLPWYFLNDDVFFWGVIFNSECETKRRKSIIVFDVCFWIEGKDWYWGKDFFQWEETWILYGKNKFKFKHFSPVEQI